MEREKPSPWTVGLPKFQLIYKDSWECGASWRTSGFSFSFFKLSKPHNSSDGVCLVLAFAAMSANQSKFLQITDIFFSSFQCICTFVHTLFIKEQNKPPLPVLFKMLCLPVSIWSFTFICCYFFEHMFIKDSCRVLWLLANLSILLWKHTSIIQMVISDGSGIYWCWVWNRSNVFLQLRQVNLKSPLLISGLSPKQAVWFQQMCNVLVTSFLPLTEFLDFSQGIRA